MIMMMPYSVIPATFTTEYTSQVLRHFLSRGFVLGMNVA
jgi:hypothetical protein